MMFIKILATVCGIILIASLTVRSERISDARARILSLLLIIVSLALVAFCFIEAYIHQEQASEAKPAVTNYIDIK